jgi:hypothetical protein
MPVGDKKWPNFGHAARDCCELLVSIASARSQLGIAPDFFSDFAFSLGLRSYSNLVCGCSLWEHREIEISLISCLFRGAAQDEIGVGSFGRRKLGAVHGAAITEIADIILLALDDWFSGSNLSPLPKKVQSRKLCQRPTAFLSRLIRALCDIFESNLSNGYHFTEKM